MVQDEGGEGGGDRAGVDADVGDAKRAVRDMRAGAARLDAMAVLHGVALVCFALLCAFGKITEATAVAAIGATLAGVRERYRGAAATPPAPPSGEGDGAPPRRSFVSIVPPSGRAERDMRGARSLAWVFGVVALAGSCSGCAAGPQKPGSTLEAVRGWLRVGCETADRALGAALGASERAPSPSPDPDGGATAQGEDAGASP